MVRNSIDIEYHCSLIIRIGSFFVFLHPKMYRTEIYAWNKHHHHVKTVNAYDTWTDDTNVSSTHIHRYTTPYDALLSGC